MMSGPHEGFEGLCIEKPAGARTTSLAEVRMHASSQSYRDTLRTLYEGRGYELHEIDQILETI